MSWAVKYIGKPWAAGAAGPHAYDCWGLVRAVYRDQLGIALPVIDVDAMSPIAVRRALDGHEERSRWRAVTPPEPYAVALMSHGQRPHHVGVWTGSGVLHAVEGAGVVHQSPASLAVHRWRILEFCARAA
jgi:cell wall-associated NlpC family hydrolase